MHKGISISLLLTSGLMAALTVVGGFIRIPALPVAFSLQTFFVYLSGVMLPNPWAPISQLIYIALGLMGLPVFSAGGGPGYILHPTFGFLLGFPMASAMVARYARKNSAAQYAVVFGVAYLLLSMTGVAYLYCNLRWIVGAPVSFSKAVFSGFLFFVPSECIKIGLAAVLAVRLAPYKKWNRL